MHHGLAFRKACLYRVAAPIFIPCPSESLPIMGAMAPLYGGRCGGVLHTPAPSYMERGEQVDLEVFLGLASAREAIAKGKFPSLKSINGGMLYGWVPVNGSRS